MIKKCPNCNQRFAVHSYEVDYEHQCNSGNLTIDQEDVLIIGNWEDYTGSGTSNQPLLQGMQIKNMGQTSWIEGDNIHKKTKRGANAETHRQRQHIEYVNLK